jgi:hypothetical protein
MDFEKVQALGVAHLARLPVEQVQGEVDGTLTFTGSLSEPNSLRAEGTITRLEAGLAEIGGTNQGYSLWNPFPMRWSLAEGQLHLDRMRLLGQGTDIAIDGTIPFALMEPAENKLDLSLGARELPPRHSDQRRFQRAGEHPRHAAGAATAGPAAVAERESALR